MSSFILEEKERGKVLLVDDNSDLIDALSLVLVSAGFEVVGATDVNEAVSLLEHDIPDIIISDVMMDGLDGFDFHDKVKEHADWGHLPFIFLSALSDPEQIRKGKSRGCDDYLIKPFHPDDLVAVLEGKLTAARKRRNLSDDKINYYRKNIIQTLSHEFRTPLVSVNNGAELLLMKLLESGDTSMINLCRSILRGGNRLQSLVEDFMTLQQIESGYAQKVANDNAQKIKLWRLLKETVQHVRDTELKPEQELVLVDLVEPGMKTAKTLIYENQISDVLKRIISNAVKFGGVEKAPKVWLACSEPGYLSIFIRDYGPGLSDDELAAATQLFGQVGRDKKEQQGCGLGLTITSYFTELNGGSALFRSPDDGKGGLEVELKFPLV